MTPNDGWRADYAEMKLLLRNHLTSASEDNPRHVAAVHTYSDILINIVDDYVVTACDTEMCGLRTCPSADSDPQKCADGQCNGTTHTDCGCLIQC